MTIKYMDKTVSPKVYAKHQVSDHMMHLFDHPMGTMDEDFAKATTKEQDEILRQVSLLEDRIHKLIGVSFKTITSKSNFTKSI